MRKVLLAAVGLVLAPLAVAGWIAPAPAYDCPDPTAPGPTCAYVWSNAEWVKYDSPPLWTCNCPDGTEAFEPSFPGQWNNQVVRQPCVQLIIKPTAKPFGGPVMDNEPRPMPSVRE